MCRQALHGLKAPKCKKRAGYKQWQCAWTLQGHSLAQYGSAYDMSCDRTQSSYAKYSALMSHMLLCMYLVQLRRENTYHGRPYVTIWVTTPNRLPA